MKIAKKREAPMPRINKLVINRRQTKKRDQGRYKENKKPKCGHCPTPKTPTNKDISPEYWSSSKAKKKKNKKKKSTTMKTIDVEKSWGRRECDSGPKKQRPNDTRILTEKREKPGVSE